MNPQRSYDYVVVGAGSAGCVVASRLTEDADCSVLLLEAGSWDTRQEIHQVDLQSLFALWTSDWSPQLDWGYSSEPEPKLAERRIPVSRAKVVGGCSSTNALMWVRGNRSDYDGWAALGNPGWSYDDLLACFIRSESYDRPGSSLRGGEGPIQVSSHRRPTPVATTFVAAAAELGYRPEADYNAERQDGFGFLYQTSRTPDGQRCSTATGYLHPARSRTNLSIEVGAQASRLLIENGRVIGLEYRQDGRLERVGVNRELVLSAGAFESPKLLLLSGIGPADQLTANGVDCIADLPGVGQNLQDHLFVPVCYQSLREHPPAELVSEAGLFVRTELAGAQAPAGPDLQFTFGAAKFLAPDAPAQDQQGPGFTFAPVAIRPHSRGELRLRNNDPATPATVRFNYLADERDLDVLLYGIDLARELVQTRAFDDFRGRELTPGQPVTDRAGLRAFVASAATTLWHPVGTCRMGAIDQDPTAVVDSRLQVHGIDGLRVVDASVMPTITSGNTNAPSVAIAEKAVDLIRHVDRTLSQGALQ